MAPAIGECLNLWVKFGNVLTRRLVIRFEPEFGFPLCNLVHISTETCERTEEVGLSFGVPVIAFLTMSMLFQVDIYTDRFQSNVGPTAFVAMKYLHHKVVLTEGFEPTNNCLGNSAQFQFGVVSKRPSGSPDGKLI